MRREGREAQWSETGVVWLKVLGCGCEMPEGARVTEPRYRPQESPNPARGEAPPQRRGTRSQRRRFGHAHACMRRQMHALHALNPAWCACGSRNYCGLRSPVLFTRP